MTQVAASSRPFVPGTTGWTARDLEDPQIERQWFQGRFEIVNGVLALRPPSYFVGASALQELTFALAANLQSRGIANDFGCGVDIILGEDRVIVADCVWLTPEDQRGQCEAVRKVGKADPERTRMLVPPTLVIESITPGHEWHDERTKRRWYAEFGIPNYWILDGFAKSLKCLVLSEGEYQVDAEGRGTDEIRPSLFPELAVSSGTLWLEM